MNSEDFISPSHENVSGLQIGEVDSDILAPYKGRTILVSGATGYLGSALIQALSGTAGRIVLLVHRELDTVPPGCSDFLVVQGDVAVEKTWLKALPGVDYLFHFAAYEHKHGSRHDPTLDLNVNALSVLKLLEVCRKKGFGPKIIFASSSNLAGIPAELPVDETSPDEPLTIYAIHKLTSEKYLQYYAREFQLRTITLRLANVYGPCPDWNAVAATRVVLNQMIKRALTEQALTLFENHACLRDYIFIDDVIRAFLVAGASNISSGQYFVIGSGLGVTIAEAVNMIAERVGIKKGWPVSVSLVQPPVRLPPVEMRNFVADTTCFRRATDWQARVSLVDGIDRTIDSFLAESGDRLS